MTVPLCVCHTLQRMLGLGRHDSMAQAGIPAQLHTSIPEQEADCVIQTQTPPSGPQPVVENQGELMSRQVTLHHPSHLLIPLSHLPNMDALNPCLLEGGW